MAWVQIKIETSAGYTKQIENLLMELGSAAVTLEDSADQPLFEPPPGELPLWEKTRVIGLFEAMANMDLIVAALKNTITQTPFPPYRIEPLEDKDWEREWMDSFKPMQFGSRLWVCPGWLEVPDPGAVNLRLDPGLAFGTGTHETTALCLEWLEKQPLEGKTLIDYGCGSGILGIAAALLGCREVWAVDNDPQALWATRENAARNQVDHRLQVYSPDTLPAIQADILVANILSGPLKTLAARLGRYVRPAGDIALSGILTNQSEELLDRYSHWFSMSKPVGKKGWVRLSGTRKP